MHAVRQTCRVGTIHRYMASLRRGKTQMRFLEIVQVGAGKIWQAGRVACMTFGDVCFSGSAFLS
jgi:hypothetical protein